jgi:hypothetical protein
MSSTREKKMNKTCARNERRSRVRSRRRQEKEEEKVEEEEEEVEEAEQRTCEKEKEEEKERMYGEDEKEKEQQRLDNELHARFLDQQEEREGGGGGGGGGGRASKSKEKTKEKPPVKMPDWARARLQTVKVERLEPPEDASVFAKYWVPEQLKPPPPPWLYPCPCIPRLSHFQPSDYFCMESCGCSSTYCRKCGFRCVQGNCGQCHPSGEATFCACVTYYCDRCLQYIPSADDGFVGPLPECVGRPKYTYNPLTRENERDGNTPACLAGTRFQNHI